MIEGYYRMTSAELPHAVVTEGEQAPSTEVSAGGVVASASEKTPWRARLEDKIREVLWALHVRYDAAEFAYTEAVRRRAEGDGWKESDPVVAGLQKGRNRGLQKLALFEQHPTERNFHEACAALTTLENGAVVDADDGLFELDRQWYLEDQFLAGAIARLCTPQGGSSSAGECAQFEGIQLAQSDRYRCSSNRKEKEEILKTLRETRAEMESKYALVPLEKAIVVEANDLEAYYRETVWTRLRASSQLLLKQITRRAHDGASLPNSSR